MEFLQEVGMFREYKQLDDYTENERFDAKARYYNAVSVSIQGSAMVFMISNYNFQKVLNANNAFFR